MISLLTPTADQPIGFAQCEVYMRRQTVWGQLPLQWIVVDDGLTPILPTCGQTYIRRMRAPQESGAASLCRNLLAGLPAVEGDVLCVIEHDDWYSPRHVEQLLAQLADPQALIAGDAQQRYYNVARRLWRIYANRGSCLCQTGLKRKVLSHLTRAAQRCLAHDSYGVDATLWGSLPTETWRLDPSSTVVGIKGLPGRAGLGVGHRPHGPEWKPDPACKQLRAWVGSDAAFYADFYGSLVRTS